MKFNRGNYEAYVLDWLEGKLSGPDHNLFLKFLEENPDIYNEIKAISNIQLQPAGIQFHDKHILKKPPNLLKFDAEFERICVAFIEGDLESEEKQKFESWLSENPHKLIEFELFRKSQLKPDINIVFSPKSKLKRLSVGQIRIRLISAISAAAIIVLVIIIIRNNGFLNQDLYTNKAVTNHSVPEKTAVIEDEIVHEGTDNQIADNQLIVSNQEKKSGQNILQNLNKNSGSYDKNSSDINYPDFFADLSKTELERPELQPVSSVYTTIKNNYSADLNKLKETKSHPSLDFDSYMTLGEFASNKILGSLLPGGDSTRQAKITFWDLASTGFDELNQITSGGYSLEREIGRSGKLKRISVETPLLGISIPIKNKQLQ